MKFFGRQNEIKELQEIDRIYLCKRLVSQS